MNKEQQIDLATEITERVMSLLTTVPVFVPDGGNDPDSKVLHEEAQPVFDEVLSIIEKATKPKYAPLKDEAMRLREELDNTMYAYFDHYVDASNVDYSTFDEWAEDVTGAPNPLTEEDDDDEE